MRPLRWMKRIKPWELHLHPQHLKQTAMPASASYIRNLEADFVWFKIHPAGLPFPRMIAAGLGGLWILLGLLLIICGNEPPAVTAIAAAIESVALWCIFLWSWRPGAARAFRLPQAFVVSREGLQNRAFIIPASDIRRLVVRNEITQLEYVPALRSKSLMAYQQASAGHAAEQVDDGTHGRRPSHRGRIIEISYRLDVEGSTCLHTLCGGLDALTARRLLEEVRQALNRAGYDAGDDRPAVADNPVSPLTAWPAADLRPSRIELLTELA